MVLIDSVRLTLLLLASDLHGDAFGHIQTHVGSRVSLSAIQSIKFIEISAFSRLKCFVQCASYFKSQHLVFFDDGTERAHESRRQVPYEKYRLKCAPAQFKAVVDGNLPRLRERPQEGDGNKNVNPKLCQRQTQTLEKEDYTTHVSSSHEAPPEKEVDVFVRSRYVVITLTGHGKVADTKTGVYLELTGEVASHKLFLKNSGNEMQLGQNDTFHFSAGCSIGRITRMQLYLPSILSLSSVSIDQWFCVKIDLRRELEYTRHLDVEVFHSNVSRWLPRLSVLNIVGPSAENIAYTRLEAYRKDF